MLDKLVGEPTHWFRLAPCFLGGTLVYQFRDQIVWHWLGALVLLGVLLVGSRLAPGLRLAIPMAGVYLFFYLAFHRGWSWPLASRSGDISYGIYLFSCPIQQLMVAKLTGFSPLALVAVSLLASVVAGMASWYLVERRFLASRPTPKPAAGVAPAC